MEAGNQSGTEKIIKIAAEKILAERGFKAGEAANLLGFALVDESGTFAKCSSRIQASGKCLVPESPCRIWGSRGFPLKNHENPHIVYRGFSNLSWEGI